jgi:tetratricopeptide (TPR) repeat protein
MTDIVSDFQSLIDRLSSSSSKESDLLLLQLDPISAHRIRLCAIPHTFDAAVLRLLDLSLDASTADEAMREYQSLAAVVQLPNSLALHDVIREQLFQQWLLPERRDEFSSVSRRLAQYYEPDQSTTAVERAAKENGFVFHMYGADPDEGFKCFQLLYAKRREQLNTSGCAILVRLLREYDTSLSSTHSGWLTFYEAEIASDSRDWLRAQNLLNNLLAKDIAPNLRSMALLRLGSVLRQSGHFKDAEAACLQALKLIDGSLSVHMDGGASLHLVHYQLGLIARDQGDVERARKFLEDAVRLAKAARIQTDVVAASNSLGTLLLRDSPREAIRIFTECVNLLSPLRDGVRIAQIMNNLAIAHANAGEWDQSESYYQKSLDIKRADADYHGQASTLFNMARLYKSLNKLRQAHDAISEAAALFEKVHDIKSSALAYRELARMDRASRSGPAKDNAIKALTYYKDSGQTREYETTMREFSDLLGRRRWQPWMTLIKLVQFLSRLG